MSAHIKPEAGRTYVMRLGATVTVTGVNGNLVYYRIHGDPSIFDRRLDYVSFANSIEVEVVE